MMLDGVPITYWIGFHAVVLVLIVAIWPFSVEVRPPPKPAAIFFLSVCCSRSPRAFGGWIGHVEGHQTALEFASGYLIELSLSIDNLFVFLLMFRSFGLSAEDKGKALLLGILGAIVMRGIFIFAGIELLERFAWIQYFFGALLLVAALRLLRGERKAGVPPLHQPSGLRNGQSAGAAVPKATFLLAVIAIELVDLVFAIDSVPAVLAISHHPFVVYTSNIFAILGLRSLYFLLAGCSTGCDFFTSAWLRFSVSSAARCCWQNGSLFRSGSRSASSSWCACGHSGFAGLNRSPRPG
jgi:tellurite resistance protein TerC